MRNLTAPAIPVGRGGLAKPTCPPQAETAFDIQ